MPFELVPTSLQAQDLLLSLECKHHLAFGIAIGVYTQCCPSAGNTGLAIL